MKLPATQSDFLVTELDMTLNKSDWLGRISCQKLNNFVLHPSFFKHYYTFSFLAVKCSRIT
jgi:hypothetical protein